MIIVNAVADDWPALQEIPNGTKAEELPAEAIPGPLRAYVDDVAGRLNVAREAVAVPLVVAAGSLIGRRVGVMPKAYDPWTVYPNLWAALVSRPSTKKSACLTAATCPLQRIADRLMAEWIAEAPRRSAELKVLDAMLKKALRGSPDAATVAELEERRAAADTRARRLIANDANAESLQEILRVNPHGVLILRDELAGLLAMEKRQGREGERQLLLEAWAGNAPFTVDRIGRGTVYVPNLTIAILGTLQPETLHKYLGDGMADGGDGLAARFLLVAPEDRPFRNVDRPLDAAAAARVERVFEALDRIEPREPLRFASDARADVDEWLDTNGHEARRSESPGFESWLAKQPKTFATLALVFHAVDAVDRGTPLGDVSRTAACHAAAWCEVLATHAAKAYGAATPARRAALALAEKIEAGEVGDGTTLRDVYNRQWRNLGDREAVEAAVDELSAFGWARIEQRETGGRPSGVIRLHPALVGRSHR